MTSYTVNKSKQAVAAKKYFSAKDLYYLSQCTTTTNYQCTTTRRRTIWGAERNKRRPRIDAAATIWLYMHVSKKYDVIDTRAQ